MPYEGTAEVSSGTRARYIRSNAAFFGTHHVLCLHGPLGQAEDFATFVDGVNSERFTCVAWDEPNRAEPMQGSVAQTNNLAHELERRAEQAVELMQRLFYTPFSIIGHEQGGLLALHLAAKYKTYVRGVIVCNMPAKVDSAMVESFAGAARQACSQKPSSFALQFGGRNRYEQTMQRLIQIRAKAATTHTPLLNPLVYNRVTQPMLILQASDDPLCPSEQGYYVKRLVGQARIATCQNSYSSNLHIDELPWFKKQVEDFLYFQVDDA